MAIEETKISKKILGIIGFLLLIIAGIFAYLNFSSKQDENSMDSTSPAKFLAARTGNPTFNKETIYIYISDGGIQEEVSQGAGRIAGHLGLDNVIMFYDANDIQLSTEVKEVMTEDTAMKYRAWGWNVMEIDGNDCQQIREALDAAKKEDKRPTLIIGKCIMGKALRG